MSENINTQINGGGCVLMARNVRMRVFVMASFFFAQQNGQESKCENKKKKIVRFFPWLTCEQ